MSGLKEFAAKEKLEIVPFASASRRGGRKGGLVFSASARRSPLMKSVRPSSRNFVSLRGKDIFKYTPPVGKRGCWLALILRDSSRSGSEKANCQRTCQKCRLGLYEGQKRAFLHFDFSFLMFSFVISIAFPLIRATEIFL